jgi:hypothetical protein
MPARPHPRLPESGRKTRGCGLPDARVKSPPDFLRLHHPINFNRPLERHSVSSGDRARITNGSPRPRASRAPNRARAAHPPLTATAICIQSHSHSGAASTPLPRDGRRSAPGNRDRDDPDFARARPATLSLFPVFLPWAPSTHFLPSSARPTLLRRNPIVLLGRRFPTICLYLYLFIFIRVCMYIYIYTRARFINKR